MKTSETKLPGCFELFPVVHRDERGSFAKTFHAPSFAAAGLATDFVEEFHSRSLRCVLRGLHFQAPPHEHAKLVYCPDGEVFDAAVDLRQGSPTEGEAFTTRLSAERGNALYLPAGLAHGFQVLSEEAVVVYAVTSVHAPEADAGIRWDSAGIAWPLPSPILSARDRAFPALRTFATPFLAER